MVKIFLVTILTVTFFACKKSSSDHCNPEYIAYRFQNSMNIDTISLVSTNPSLDLFWYTISPGNKIVFTYTYQFRDCPEIADDEGVKTIVFEIPQQSDSFVLDDSMEFKTAKCLIRFACFCNSGEPALFKHGVIEGTRLSTNSWKLKASLQVPWNTQETITFDNVFTLK